MLRFVLRYAALAPSSHNSQPWLFHVDGNAVEVYADRTRRLPVVDPDDRELVMSCGAALYNLRLALRHFGERSKLSVLPEGTDSDLLARVDPAGRGDPRPPARGAVRGDHQPAHLPSSIRRRSDPPGVVQRLRQAASAEGSVAGRYPEGAETLGDEPRHRGRFRPDVPLGLPPGAGPLDASQPPARDDGMPGYALGMSELQSVVGPLIVRTFDVGKSQAAKDDELSRGSALLALIVTETDDVTDWIAAGQAMQRVLLTATAAGLRASFLNQPIEISSMRLQLARALALQARSTAAAQVRLQPELGTDATPPGRRHAIERPADPTEHRSPLDRTRRRLT